MLPTPMYDFVVFGLSSLPRSRPTSSKEKLAERFTLASLGLDRFVRNYENGANLYLRETTRREEASMKRVPLEMNDSNGRRETAGGERAE